MSQENSFAQSQLFTVRIWKEDLGEEHSEWRGKLQHVSSGEAYYFNAWEELVEFLLRLMSEQNLRTHHKEQSLFIEKILIRSQAKKQLST
jgi:hypothetical protein